MLDVLFEGEAQVLLLDEPDNFLDVPAKLELEARIAASRKTVLLISHDRDLLGAACNAILTLEANGTWLHGGSYTTYPEAREARQERLGDRLEQWKREERRLFRFYKIMKQRAAISDGFARKADAAETRWQRFVDAGPPPAPVVDQQINVRIRGGDSARIVVALRDLGIDGLVRPFEEEIHFGERIGLIGPNGSGKTHLMRLLAGEEIPHAGTLRIGNRVSAGLFTQLNARAGSRAPRRPRRGLRAAGGARAVDARARPLPPAGGRQPLDRHALRRPEGAARDPHAWSSRATTCCCSTSRPTTSTSTPPRRSRTRSTASRARSSRSPTTGRSCAGSTASCCSRTTGRSTRCPTPRPRWRRSRIPRTSPAPGSPSG